MKKMLPALFIAGILFACKKDKIDEADTPIEVKKPIQFSIENFISQCQPIPSANCSMAGLSRPQISHVYYVAYASDGTQLKIIHHDTASNKMNLGVISDTLAPGSYTIVMYASKFELETKELKATNIKNSIIGPLHGGQLTIWVSSLGDFFYKKMQVVINAKESPSTQDIVLNRLTGRLKLDIPDASPTTGLSPQCTLPIHFYLNNDSVERRGYAYYMTATNQATIEEYLFGSDLELKAYLRYYDKNTGKPITKIFDHIKCNINKETLIGGNLYATSPPYIPSVDTACGNFFSMDSASTVLDWLYLY